jgi:hypothetical protein
VIRKWIDLAGNRNRQTGTLRDFQRQVRGFFFTDTPKPEQAFALYRSPFCCFRADKLLQRDAVWDKANHIRQIGKAAALGL